MDKIAIGYKVSFNTSMVILLVAAGVAIIAGAVGLFIFVIGGAIGGGIAGVGIFLGGSMCRLGIAPRNLPDELVHIDDMTLYLNKRTIGLEEIKSVKGQGYTLTVKPKQGRVIMQGLLKNSKECAQQIIDRLGL